MLWKNCMVCLSLLSLSAAHVFNAAPANRTTIKKRDTVVQQNAKDTLVNTLDNWRNGVMKFFTDGIRVDSETSDVTHTIHKFSRNIGEAGNAFVETVHGTGVRNVKPPSLPTFSEPTKPSSMPKKRLNGKGKEPKREQKAVSSRQNIRRVKIPGLPSGLTSSYDVNHVAAPSARKLSIRTLIDRNPRPYYDLMT